MEMSPNAPTASANALTPRFTGRGTPDQAKEIAKSMYAGQDLKALAACGRAFPQLEVDAARFGTLQVPTLFIYGGSESRFVLDRMAEAQLILPRAEIKVIEGANHITALRSPQFSSTVVEFVQRHRGR
jgi:pimeloyl-ACP methyl ester carboxylesterase